MVRRQLAGLLIVMLLASPSWAAVTYDADTTQQAASGTSNTFNHVIGTGSNVYVGVCAFTRSSPAADVISVTIDGSAGAHIVTAIDTVDSANVRVEMWGRALGSKTGSIAIDTVWDQTDAPRIVAFSMFGVDQTTPVGTPQSTAPGTYPTSLSVNVSSATDELVLSCLALASSSSSITVGAGQTEQWLNTTNSNSTQDQGSTEPGGATVTMSHSWTTADYAALVAAPFRAAPDGQPAHLRGGTIPGMNSLGLGGPLP